MVKIRNIYGDINIGRHDNAVYQRKYGRAMRRVYKEVKPASSPLQKEQNERFKSTIAWIKRLSNEEKESAKQYCRDHNIGSAVGEPIHWYNWLKNFGLKVPVFKILDSETSKYRVSHPGIYKIEEFSSSGESLFSVDDLTNFVEGRYLSLFEQTPTSGASLIRVTTISGHDYEYTVFTVREVVISFPC